MTRGVRVHAAMTRFLALGAVLALLAGCAATPPAGGPAAAKGDARAPARDPAITAFEARQRAAAESAFQQGRHADALWAWDTVLALAPQDAAAARRRADVAAAAEAAAQDRTQRARQAQQRGETDNATRLYLEAIAALPGGHPLAGNAADALREMERERTKRGNVVGFRAAQALQPRSGTAAERNELEHATMLAGQGEVDAAIATLEPLVARRPPDSGARALLADLLVRRADRLQPQDVPGAIAALERALQLVPGHRAAAGRLRTLRP